MVSKEQSRHEYIARINLVMDYIEKHLSQAIDLRKLADVACFSPYHFHRLFTVMVGETPNNFLLRIRVEKSVHFLQNTSMPISDIAYQCGFNNASTFSRTFRKFFGVTAKEYREREKAVYVNKNLHYSKNGQIVRKNGQYVFNENPQFCNVELKDLIIMDAKIEIKDMPEMNVIYVRHQGEFNQIGKAYEKVMKWAGPRGLLNFPETKLLTVYHDDPNVTSLDKVRQDACITVDRDVKTEGEIGKMTVEGGKYAVGHFEIDVTQFQQAWNSVCLWLTESGYQPEDKNTYELYYNDHTQHPERKFILDICVPVKPL